MTQTTTTATPNLLDALVDAVVPTLDEALEAYEAYEASGGTDDFHTWNDNWASSYIDCKFDALGSSPKAKNPAPAKSPSKPSKASKAIKPTKPAKAPVAPTVPPVEVKETAPAIPVKLVVTPKSGKVETSLTPAEKVKRQTLLESITADIRKETSDIATSYMRIGYRLLIVKRDKLFAAVDVDGKALKNVYEYSEMAFGFKRSSAKNFISICERFSKKGSDSNPTDEVDPAYTMFGFTQLSEMLPLSDETLANVKPEMTKAQIRELKTGQPAGQSEKLEKPQATVCFSGTVTDQTWDKILEKLDKKCRGHKIQILICD